MTKKAMVEIIEKSGMVVNFSKNYFAKMSKENVERIYNHIVNNK